MRKMHTRSIRIICTAVRSNQMCFYAETGSDRVFLFFTPYYDPRVEALYRTGISLGTLISTRYPKRLGKNPFGGVRLQKIRDHVLRSMRYYEKEADMPIFRQTKKHKNELRRYAA